MRHHPFILAALAIVLGGVILVGTAFGIVWLALGLRGIEMSWWPALIGRSDAWPDSVVKLVGEFGPVGDFIGGILNPLVAFCAFLGLFISLMVQRESAALQLDQENFFKLLANRESAIANLQLRRAKSRFTGRSAIQEIIKYIDAEAGHFNPQGRSRGVALALTHQGNHVRYVGDLRKCVELFALLYRGRVFDAKNPVEVAALDKFQKTFDLESLEEMLGHIFRSTYQVLKFAHGCESFTNGKKVDLVNYLRAQMSESEFVVFGLSALTPIGDKSRAVSIAFDLFQDRLRSTRTWARAMRYFFNPAQPLNVRFAYLYRYSLVNRRRSSDRILLPQTVLILITLLRYFAFRPR